MDCCVGEGIAKGMIEGNCLQMCPTKEQQFRERISDIDSFERLREGGPPVLAVKKFARNVRRVANETFTLVDGRASKSNGNELADFV